MPGGRESNSRRCDGTSNVRLERELHPAKQSSPTTSTVDGRKTDFRVQQSENALAPIRISSEPTGIGEVSSLQQSVKESSPIILTDGGEITVTSEERLDSNRTQF
jgi:hypothetical protein